jgi:DNA-binding NarL/FixJ family response regulator
MPPDSVREPESIGLIADKTTEVRTRVIVADDHSSIRSTVCALLEVPFNVVDLCCDGQTALEATLKLQPDIVVLDVSMPGMSGIEVANELRRLGNRARIVFLTVHEDARVLAGCLAAGGLGYVVKEQMDADLISAANEALAGRVFVSRWS